MDWNNSKRNFLIKIIIALFAMVGVVLLLTPHGWWPTYYDLPYMGWASLVCALLIALAPARFQLALAVIFLLNSSGDLGLYELYRHGFEYDKVIHFVSPLIATMTLIPVIGWRRTVLVIGALAIGWEVFEYVSDALIKTHLFGVFRHEVWIDTIEDTICNALGITTGVLMIILVRYRNHGNSGNLDQSGKAL